MECKKACLPIILFLSLAALPVNGQDSSNKINASASIPPIVVPSSNSPPSNSNNAFKNENLKNFEQHIAQIKQLINQNKGQEALTLLKPLLANTKNFDLYVLTGQTYAILNQPKNALFYYLFALKVAKDETEKRIAVFGIAKMQLWLGENDLAEKNYRYLLSTALDEEDKKMAMEGLAKSLQNQRESKPTIKTTENQDSQPELEKTRLARIKKLIENEKGKEALDALLPMIKEKHSFDLYILAGQSAAIADQPNTSLIFYQKALQLSSNKQQTRVALFGIGKNQNWLTQYKQAEITYRKLLRDQLDEQSYQTALEGLIISLNGQDKHKIAIAKLPTKLKIRTPGLLVAIAQSYLAAGEKEKAHKLLLDNKSLIAQIKKGSSLDKRLTKLYQAKTFLPQPTYSFPEQKMFADLIKTANKLFEKEKYDEALCYYKDAWQYAFKCEDKSAVLFGFGKIYLAEGCYKRALDTYRELLNNYKLKADDFEVALNGYVRSLSTLDKPRKAYCSIPLDFHYTMPAMWIGALQSLVWADWHYKADALLLRYYYLLNKVERQSYLYKQFKDTSWQIKQAMDKNKIWLNHYGEKDSDDFSISHNRLSYIHKFSPYTTTGIIYDHAKYFQPNADRENAIFDEVANILIAGDLKASADSYFLRQDWIISDYLRFFGYVGWSNFSYWDPVLWFADFVYRPYDWLRLEIFNKNEVVEAFPALKHKILLNSTELTGTVEPIYGLFLTGTTFYHSFTNDNIRRGYVNRASYLIAPDLGLSVIGKWRYYTNTNPNNGEYFSPAVYREFNGLLRLEKRFMTTWRYYAQYGEGKQKIENDPWFPTYQYELGARGPICEALVIDFFYGYTNASGTTGTGFGRHYWGLTIEILL